MVLSIIVPVFNTQEYLERCLSSIVSNREEDYEVILINDGSTDNSKEICEMFVNRYPQRFRLYNKQNEGLSSARNYAIKQGINGIYMLFLDSDDYLEEGFLDVICKRLSMNDNIDIYEYGYIIHHIGKKNKIVIPSYQLEEKSCVNGKQYLKAVLKEKETYEWYPWKYIIKRDYFDGTGLLFAEGKKYEDVLLIPKLILQGERIGTFSDIGYHYMLGRPGAITGTFRLETEIDKLYAAKHNIEFFDNEKDEKLRRLAQDNFSKLYYSALTFLYVEKNRDQRSLFKEELLQKKDIINCTLSGQQTVLKWIIKVFGIQVCAYLLYIRRLLKIWIAKKHCFL